jgi:hypothetical protein
MDPDVNVNIQRSEGVAVLGIPREHWEAIATEVVEIGNEFSAGPGTALAAL